MTEDEIIKIVQDQIKKNFPSKKVGDTPTDALQLANKKYVDSKTAYSGYVNAAGTAGTPFPSGWTVGLSAHLFTITHNLGTTSYGVTLTSVGTAYFGEVVARNANTFTCQFWNTVPALNDTDFMFVLK